MTWQEVVGVNKDNHSIILRNASGETYEVPLLSQIEELLEEDELHVNINPFPGGWDLPVSSPPLINGWHSGDWEDVTEASDNEEDEIAPTQK